MAKSKILTKFEQSRFVELLGRGLLQRAIANEIVHSRTVIANFIKNPDVYASKNQAAAPVKAQHFKTDALSK